MGRLISTRVCGVFAIGLFTLGLLALPACSDDGGNSTPADSGVDKSSPDSAADTGADSAPDDAEVDAPTSDGGGQEASTPDVGLDLAPDLPAVTDAGPADLNANGGLYGKVTTKVMPAYDGKGTLYVGLHTPFLPPPLPPQEYRTINNVDLSAPGKSVSYQFLNNPAPGNYLLYAFLDDNGNAAFPFLAADAGDIVVAAAVPVTITAGQPGPQLNIDLTAVVGGVAGDGGVGDAAPTIGSLEGKIAVKTTPALDAKGNIHVQIFDTWPPAGGPLASTFVGNADLSSPFASVKYFIGGMAPGQYYVNVFLDDNANAAGFPFTPASDANDITTAQPVQVRIEAGVATTADLMLDKVIP